MAAILTTMINKTDKNTETIKVFPKQHHFGTLYAASKRFESLMPANPSNFSTTAS